MFNNPGDKIKKWAKALFIILIIVGLLSITTIRTFFLQALRTPGLNQYIGYTKTGITIFLIIAFILFVIINYVICLLIYGFGELVDNSTTINNDLDEQKHSLATITGGLRAIYLNLRDSKVQV